MIWLCTTSIWIIIGLSITKDWNNGKRKKIFFFVNSVEDYARHEQRVKEKILMLFPNGLMLWGCWYTEHWRNIYLQISKMFGKHLSYLHDKYVVVPNNKANNNIVFVCRITLHRKLERNYVLTIYLATPHRKCILYTLLYKQKSNTYQLRYPLGR